MRLNFKLNTGMRDSLGRVGKKLRNTLKGILFYDTGTFIIIKGNRFFFFFCMTVEQVASHYLSLYKK